MAGGCVNEYTLHATIECPLTIATTMSAKLDTADFNPLILKVISKGEVLQFPTAQTEDVK